MVRTLALAAVLAALIARLAVADPAVSVRYEPGAAVIQLEGDYANHWYTVSRGESRDGPFTPLTDSNVLCLGACAVTDAAAAAGRTYWYRFELRRADGTFASYGPYPVTISSEIERRLRAAVFPQPVRGLARIEIHLAGGGGEPPVPVRAALFDVQGRRVSTVHAGPLPRGRNVLSWSGERLAAGLYVLRVESPLGTATARLVRAR